VSYCKKAISKTLISAIPIIIRDIYLSQIDALPHSQTSPGHEVSETNRLPANGNRPPLAHFHWLKAKGKIKKSKLKIPEELQSQITERPLLINSPYDPYAHTFHWHIDSLANWQIITRH
jgi:hypothetical protein